MAALDDIVERTAELLQDLRPFLPRAPVDLIRKFAEDALADHSTNYPNETAVLTTGTGSRFMPVPAEFEDRWPQPILKIEWPVVEEGGHPDGLGEDVWRVYRTESGPTILFDDLWVPPAGDRVRIHLRTSHAADGSTLREHEVRALPYRAAALACRSIAARTGQAMDPNVGDSVDYGGKPTTFRDLAAMFDETYLSILGFGREQGEGGDKQVAFVRRVEWQARQLGGRPLLFHASKGRT